MSARRLPNGAQLRAQLDKALKIAAKDLPAGQVLQWDDKERFAIDAAVAAADRRSQLQARYDSRLAADAESAELVKLSAELRLCERVVVDMTSKLSIGVGQAKSERHVKASRSRWDRRDAQWAAAKESG
jgi:hypothetical protein